MEATRKTIAEALDSFREAKARYDELYPTSERIVGLTCSRKAMDAICTDAIPTQLASVNSIPVTFCEYMPDDRAMVHFGDGSMRIWRLK